MEGRFAGCVFGVDSAPLFQELVDAFVGSAADSDVECCVALRVLRVYVDCVEERGELVCLVFFHRGEECGRFVWFLLACCLWCFGLLVAGDVAAVDDYCWWLCNLCLMGLFWVAEDMFGV